MNDLRPRHAMAGFAIDREGTILAIQTDGGVVQLSYGEAMQLKELLKDLHPFTSPEPTFVWRSLKPPEVGELTVE